MLWANEWSAAMPANLHNSQSLTWRTPETTPHLRLESEASACAHGPECSAALHVWTTPINHNTSNEERERMSTCGGSELANKGIVYTTMS